MSHTDTREFNPSTAGAIQGADVIVAVCETMFIEKAATRTCADLCGVVDRLGTVEVGKLADLIALSGDPLENISNIKKLKLVLKGGQLVNTEKPEGLTDLWELLLF